VQFLCIVEHIVCLILEGIVGYVERIRLERCPQTKERWTGNGANDLKYLISG